MTILVFMENCDISTMIQILNTCMHKLHYTMCPKIWPKPTQGMKSKTKFNYASIFSNIYTTK